MRGSSARPRPSLERFRRLDHEAGNTVQEGMVEEEHTQNRKLSSRDFNPRILQSFVYHYAHSLWDILLNTIYSEIPERVCVKSSEFIF